MPFDGNNNFSIVNTFLPATVISSSQMNTNFSDIATGLSNVLVRDGQGTGMTGQFKAADGTVGAPGIAFSSDLDTGFYRIGANSVGVSMGGVQAAFWDAVLKLWLQGDLDVAGVANFQDDVGVPNLNASGGITATGDGTFDQVVSAEGGTLANFIAAVGAAMNFDHSAGGLTQAFYEFARNTTADEAILRLLRPGTTTEALSVVADGVGGDDTVSGGTLADQAEAEAGARNDKLMTPLRTAQAITEQAGVGARAWVKFSGTTINDSFNVTNIVSLGSNVFQVNWTTPFANTNYAVSVTPSNSTSGAAGDLKVPQIQVQTTGSINIRCLDGNGSGSTPDSFHVIAFGDQ